MMYAIVLACFLQAGTQCWRDPFLPWHGLNKKDLTGKIQQYGCRLVFITYSFCILLFQRIFPSLYDIFLNILYLTPHKVHAVVRGVGGGTWRLSIVQNAQKIGQANLKPMAEEDNIPIFAERQFLFGKAIVKSSTYPVLAKANIMADMESQAHAGICQPYSILCKHRRTSIPSWFITPTSTNNWMSWFPNPNVASTHPKSPQTNFVFGGSRRTYVSLNSAVMLLDSPSWSWKLQGCRMTIGTIVGIGRVKYGNISQHCNLSQVGVHFK